MHSIKKSLAQTVSLKLQELIQQGRWQEKLPGIRVLCAELEVSKQTMMLALRMLEKAGYVTPAEKGIGRLIIFDNGALESIQLRDEEVLTVTIFSSFEETRMTVIDDQIVTHLKNLLVASGYQYKFVVFKDLITKEGEKKIVDIIKQHPSEAYVLMGTHRNSVRQLLPLKLPIVYLGGEAVEGCYPRILYSLDEMYSTAVSYLKSVGHVKITCMLSALFIREDHTIDNNLQQRFKETYRKNDLPYTKLSCPAWGKTREDFMNCLKDMFRESPPTAIVVMDSDLIPRVVSFLMQHDLSYPKDISLIVLDENPILEEYNPPISYMKKSSATYARCIIQAVDKIINAPESIEEKMTIVPVKFIKTDSVKPLD